METTVIGTTAESYKKSSYRTYEEWKLFASSVPLFTNLSVLTVPMRNGNEEEAKEIESEKPVLTVPMRNGNLTQMAGPA